MIGWLMRSAAAGRGRPPSPAPSSSSLMAGVATSREGSGRNSPPASPRTFTEIDTRDASKPATFCAAEIMLGVDTHKDVRLAVSQRPELDG
jgi:hypothetical protein